MENRWWKLDLQQLPNSSVTTFSTNVLPSQSNLSATPKNPLPSASSKKEPSLDLLPSENSPIEPTEVPNSPSSIETENKRLKPPSFNVYSRKKQPFTTLHTPIEDLKPCLYNSIAQP